MIPRWILDKRIKVCLSCDRHSSCPARFQILDDAPRCPLKLLPSRDEEVAARAWPSGVPEVSGCCDSATNYLSRAYWL